MKHEHVSNQEEKYGVLFGHFLRKQEEWRQKGPYPVETTTFVTTVQTMAKKLFQLKKIIHVDNMMKHNHVRYINSKFQTRKLSK
jgi:hypothetical protein